MAWNLPRVRSLGKYEERASEYSGRKKPYKLGQGSNRRLFFPQAKEGGEEVDYGYKGKGVTIHLLVEGNGMALAVISTRASAGEREQVPKLLKQVKVRNGKGRPRSNPKEIHPDKGYDSKAMRQSLRKKGIRPVIAKRVWPNARKAPGSKVAPSKVRWVVERGFAWLQRKFRRVVNRWERKSSFWNAFLLLSVVMLWIDKVIYG